MVISSLFLERRKEEGGGGNSPCSLPRQSSCVFAWVSSHLCLSSPLLKPGGWMTGNFGVEELTSWEEQTLHTAAALTDVRGTGRTLALHDTGTPLPHLPTPACLHRGVGGGRVVPFSFLLSPHPICRLCLLLFLLPLEGRKEGRGGRAF